MNRGTGNSDSDIIDEEHYHPPRDSAGSVSSFPLYNDDDEFFDAQDGGMGGSPKPNSRRVTPNQSRGGSGYNSEGTGHTHKRQGSGSSGKSDGEGGNYINLKNLSGLTSPPLKNESLQDDISSLSSYSLEGTNIIASRNNSTDKGQPPPLPPRPTVYGEKKLSPTSSAMKLFKNIDYGQSGEDDEDHEDEEDEVRPISRAPEKYDFNLQSFRNSAINKGSAQLMLSPVKEGKREGGISDLNGDDEDDDSYDENKVQSDLPPSLRSPLNDSPPLPPASRPTSSKRLFLHQRHNSLKRRSVNINEEVLLTSALFGLNEFKPTNTPHSSGAASAAASTLETTIGLKSATSELFRDKLRLAQSLQGHEGPIWCMKFSPNGQYLATGGQDTRVLIWCIVSLPKSTKQFSSTDSSDSPTPGGSHDDLEEFGNSNNNNKTNNNNDDSNLNNNNNRNSFGKKRTSTTNNQSNATTSLSGELEGLINPFLNTEPYRIYEGHTHDITDLSWSKSNFLLSSSMDKTVRLWHVSKNDCLQYFRHPDIVTCVEFHPLHDRYFVSGCFDRRLRVWDIIPTGNVREWVSANDTITAVSFSPDGLTVAGGLIQGQIFFYEYEGMKYITQMDCRNRNGKYKKGCKVSGMTYYQRKDMVVSNADGSSPVNTPDTVNNQQSGNNNSNNNSSSTNSMKIETKTNTKSHVNFPTSSSFFKKKGANVSTNQLLVTTNDSRIRLCLLEDYSTFCKYKGLKNRSMQIKSSFSDDCEYIICGSEYGQVFIWKTFDEQIHSKIFKFNFLKQKDILRNKLYENFDANDDHCAVISALFAPIESVRRYVKSHKDLLLQLLQNQQIAQTWMQQHPHLSTGSNGSHATDGDSSNTSTKAMNEINQMSLATRVICTADFNGLIRVFYRIN